VNCSPPPALARRGRTILFRRRPHRRREAWPPEVGCAVDSPLEEAPFELPVPPKTLGVLAVVLSRSRRLSLAEKPLPDLLGPYEGSESVRSRCRDHQEEFRVMAMWKCSVSGAALCTIVGVMPGVDLREPQFFPGVFERAERCFRCEALAPAALHEMGNRGSRSPR